MQLFLSLILNKNVLAMNDNLARISSEYDKILESQTFIESDLDYHIFEKHIPFLNQLDAVETGGILVFDMFKREHIFVSKSLEKLLGYNLDDIHNTGNEYFDLRIHPEDLIQIFKSAIQYLKYFFSFEPAQRPSIRFKAINEYRIKNGDDNYIRVIEQFMPLEFDINNNMWLVVSVLDILPNANISDPATSKLYITSSGEILQYQPDGTQPNQSLSKRENQILQLISKGMPSKLIADKLFISVNTVNTHRQKIIEKLNVNNTVEAVQYANNIGLFM